MAKTFLIGQKPADLSGVDFYSRLSRVGVQVQKCIQILNLCVDIWSQTIRRQFNALEKLPIESALISEPKLLLEDAKAVAQMYLGQDSYLYCKASGTLALLHVMYDETYEAETEVETCVEALN